MFPIVNSAIVEIVKLAIFCTSILQDPYLKFNFSQDCHIILVQNMASLAISTMALFTMGNIQKKIKCSKFHETFKYHIFRKLTKSRRLVMWGVAHPCPWGHSSFLCPARVSSHGHLNQTTQVYFETPQYYILVRRWKLFRFFVYVREESLSNIYTIYS